MRKLFCKNELQTQKQGGDKNKKTNLLQINHGKGRLEDYSTSVA